MGTRLFRRLAAPLLFVAAMVAPGRAWAQDPMSDPTAYAAQVFQLTNAERTSRGLRPLNAQPQLARSATLFSEYMASAGFFSHYGPDGSTPPGRIAAQGYRWSWWGENIAYLYSGPEDVVNLWMNSPEHRANILSRNFTDLGVGVAFAPDPSGFTKILVTQDFGRPAGGGPPAPGQLAAGTTAVTFPATAVGAHPVRYFLIRNAGRGPLTGSVGTLSAPFQVVRGGGNFRLAAGASRRIGIRFTPTEHGEVDSQTLSISSDGGSAAITVSGSGK